jgi:hypothetical protein
MKALSTYLLGMMLWAGMTLTEAGLERTPLSQAAQSSYTFTIIAEPPFTGPFNPIPSLFGNGPVITNDGIVVYSVGDGFGSSIFSGDGTTTTLLVPPISHASFPLAFSVSGNGMMVTNLSGFNLPGEIIDVYDGTYVGTFGPAGTGIVNFYQPSINNRGSVAFTGGTAYVCFGGYLAPNGGIYRDDGETITPIAVLGLPADLFTIIAFPSINESGQVAFYVRDVGNNCPSTPGIEAGDLYVGDGKKLVKIAEGYSAPSLNNRGEVGFIGVTAGGLSIIVSDGKKTRIVANTSGLFADFPGTGSASDFAAGGISINDRSEVAFIAALDGGGRGIFTGPDVVKDKVIATGDLLAGSSVAGIGVMSRQSLNNNGQIAFQATLTDGRVVVVRADPNKQLVN